MISEDILGDFAELYLEWHNKVKARFDKMSDGELVEYREHYKTIYAQKYGNFMADEIIAELNWRKNLARARASRSGAYCVYHSCDAKLCPKDSH